MAQIYLDNDVSVRLTAQLQSLGHDVVHTRLIGRQAAWDDEQLQVAVYGQRLLVTHNKTDFKLLHSAWHRWTREWNASAVHYGILMLPRPLSADAARIIDHLLRSGTALMMQLWDYDDPGGWRQILVPGEIRATHRDLLTFSCWRTEEP